MKGITIGGSGRRLPLFLFPAILFSMVAETAERILIDENTAEGWSRHPVWEFTEREHSRNISRRGAEIYTFADMKKNMMVSATYADFGISGLHSITYVDFSLGKAVSAHSLKKNPGKISRLPASSEEDSSITYYDSEKTISMLKRGNRRRLLLTAPYLDLPSGEKGFKADITLHHASGEECFSSLIRHENKGISYTTRYVPLMTEGMLFRGDKIEELSPGSIAGVTWSRSRGQGKNELIDISALGSDGENSWGIALSPSSELRNAVIINGTLCKLGPCTLTAPVNGSGSWSIRDDEGRLMLEMIPAAELHYRETLRPLRGESIEIFGLFRGRLTRDNGSVFEFGETLGSLKRAIGRN